MDWRERIVTNPEILSGQPVIKGSRLSVPFILEMMAAGSSEGAILAAYPWLCAEDVRACLRYASEKLQSQKKSEIDAWIEEDC